MKEPGLKGNISTGFSRYSRDWFQGKILKELGLVFRSAKELWNGTKGRYGLSPNLEKAPFSLSLSQRTQMKIDHIINRKLLTKLSPLYNYRMKKLFLSIFLVAAVFEICAQQPLKAHSHYDYANVIPFWRCTPSS